MSAGHTLGPWVVHPSIFGYIVPADQSSKPIGAAVDPVVDREKYAKPVAVLCLPDRHRSADEVRANAMLLAAAPELLAALQVVVCDWTAQFESKGHMAPEWCKQARAVIAKATGSAS